MVVIPQEIRIRESDDFECAVCREPAVAEIRFGGPGVANVLHLCRRHIQDLAWEAVSYIQNDLGIIMTRGTEAARIDRLS